MAQRINGLGVIEALADAVCLQGIPEHIRCDDGPEMIAKALRKWVAETGPQIQYIAPVSPWENGSCESLNGKLRDKCLRQKIFGSLKEVQIVISLRQTTYNRVWPNSSLGYRPTAPVTFSDLAFRLPMSAATQSHPNEHSPKYRSDQPSCWPKFPTSLMTATSILGMPW